MSGSLHKHANFLCLVANQGQACIKIGGMWHCSIHTTTWTTLDTRTSPFTWFAWADWTNYLNSRIWRYVWASAAHPLLLLGLQYLVHPGALVTFDILGCLALCLLWLTGITWFFWPKGELFSPLGILNFFRCPKCPSFQSALRYLAYQGTLGTLATLAYLAF